MGQRHEDLIFLSVAFVQLALPVEFVLAPVQPQRPDDTNRQRHLAGQTLLEREPAHRVGRLTHTGVQHPSGPVSAGVLGVRQSIGAYSPAANGGSGRRRRSWSDGVGRLILLPVFPLRRGGDAGPCSQCLASPSPNNVCPSIPIRSASDFRAAYMDSISRSNSSRILRKTGPNCGSRSNTARK